MFYKITAVCPNITLPDDDEYLEMVGDILDNEQFLSMNQFIQHGTTTTLAHCLNVSYRSYRLCRRLGLHARCAARAGLLHDLFLYDWHTHVRDTGRHWHGLTHARAALDNADKYFDLNKRERNSILRHMFPLNITPPRYKEGYVIMYYDKVCGTLETLGRPAYIV